MYLTSCPCVALGGNQWLSQGLSVEEYPHREFSGMEAVLTSAVSHSSRHTHTHTHINMQRVQKCVYKYSLSHLWPRLCISLIGEGGRCLQQSQWEVYLFLLSHAFTELRRMDFKSMTWIFNKGGKKHFSRGLLWSNVEKWFWRFWRISVLVYGGWRLDGPVK